MRNAVAGAAVAPALLVVAGFVTRVQPFLYRDPIVELAPHIADSVGKRWLDSHVVIGVRS